MRQSIALLATAALVLAACGDDESSDDADTTSATPVATEADDVTDEPSSPPTTGTDGGADSGAEADEGSGGGESGDDGGGDDAGDADGAPSGGGFGSGTASLTLANGESFEFSTLCALEPQEAAGSEILFTVVSNDDPGLDVTQFGDEGTVTDLAVITVVDGSTFETLWEASSFNETFGGTLTLTLDGSVVAATGSFYPGGDIGAEPVDGDLIAQC
ncbi:MAG: hypothetical protein AAGA42_18185 [Actinomycetota bacterium]